MGSVIKDSKTGLVRLAYFNATRNRKTLYLGRITHKDAMRINTYVDNLVNAQITKQPLDADTARWVATIGDKLAKKLAAHGLIEARTSGTLTDFIDAHVAARTHLKPSTLVKHTATKKYLIEFFGVDKTLRDFTPGDADDWRIFLIQKGLGENTIRKYCQIAKQYFKAAIRKKLVDVNPFAEIKSSTMANPERFYFVTREEADAVLEACPDCQWRLIFALCRFGGLRCPSEVLVLTWDDIDFEGNRMTVRSPKTEHLLGKGSRQVPLFPELRPFLVDAYIDPERDDKYVITRTRSNAVNLRTGLQRIIKKAGLEPWPKLFQNLRSTRETELVQEHPVHVVCSWIGNSAAVAAKHYLQVTEDDFQKATQNRAQTVPDSGFYGVPASLVDSENPYNSSVGHSGLPVYMSSMLPLGLEPRTY